MPSLYETKSDLATALTAYITDLRARAAAAGKASEWMKSDVGMHVYGDGTATIRIAGHEYGGAKTPLAVAMAEAEDWLTRDEIAELNATLGLAPDGRLAEAA